MPVAVRHQEFDADIPENRLLMAGLRAFRSALVHVPSTLTRLHRLRTLLGAVTPVVPRDIRWTPLNQHYRPAAELAWLLLDGCAADLAHGSTQVPAFVLDMGSVFERFVRVALRIALGVAEHDFPSGRNAPRVTLDDLGKLVTEPDLNLLVDGERRFVGEIKYKVDTGRAKAADRYQLLAAAIATGLPDATPDLRRGAGRPHSRPHHPARGCPAAPAPARPGRAARGHARPDRPARRARAQVLSWPGAPVVGGARGAARRRRGA